MARKTKEEKRIEEATNLAFKTLANGILFNIMDVGKVLDAGHKAGSNGENIETAVSSAIAVYRQN